MEISCSVELSMKTDLYSQGQAARFTRNQKNVIYFIAINSFLYERLCLLMISNTDEAC